MIRFGHDWDPTCMKMDETLYKIADKVKNFAVIYLVGSWGVGWNVSFSSLSSHPHPPTHHTRIENHKVDITQVPEFNSMYELFDPCSVRCWMQEAGGGQNLWLTDILVCCHCQNSGAVLLPQQAHHD